MDWNNKISQILNIAIFSRLKFHVEISVLRIGNEFLSLAKIVVEEGTAEVDDQHEAREFRSRDIRPVLGAGARTYFILAYLDPRYHGQIRAPRVRNSTVR